MDVNINENDNDFKFNKPYFKLVDFKITILWAPKDSIWSEVKSKRLFPFAQFCIQC